MSERIDRLKAKLAASREKVFAAMDRIGERGDEQVYSDGAQWTLRQLAIHLAIADGGHNEMCYRYSRGEEYIPEGYDIDRYNKSSVGKRESMTLDEARASMEKTRSELIAWLDNLDDESVLDKTGRHPVAENVTVHRIIEINAIHEDGHANDILAMLDS